MNILDQITFIKACLTNKNIRRKSTISFTRVKTYIYEDNHRSQKLYFFQLDQLKFNNEHHKFEDLCREIAKAKICSNILPSTGPVAGGDGGRDFENFKTYISEQLTNTNIFYGNPSQRNIVFACTLQKDNVQTKIKNDVKLICESPLPVDDIIYFCSEQISSKKSLELREWAHTNKNIILQIFDGKAISEILSDEDLFWVAQQFLSAPLDYYPEKHNKESWYKECLEFWKTNSPNLYSYANFFEIKKALRHAKTTKAAKIDLLFWLQKMESFISDSSSIDNLRRSAIYEVLVASLRGLGNMSSQIEKLKEYFNDTDRLNTHSELLEAAVLLNYCVPPVKLGELQIEQELILKWINQIITKVDNELSSSSEPNRRCFLLRIKGLITLTYQLQAETLDINQIFTYWQELVETAKDGKLFPMQEFSNDLTDLIEKVPYLGDFPIFMELCSQIDEIVAVRVGENVVAKHCQKRAQAFLANKQVILALKELHNARIKWFSGDTLRESLFAALTIAECFLQLKMVYAAKYYVLGVLYIIQSQDDVNIKVLLPRCILTLMRIDFLAGSWLNNVSMLEAVYVAESIYSNNLNPEKNKCLGEALSYFFTAYKYAHKTSKDLFEHIDNKLLEFLGSSEKEKDVLVKQFFPKDDPWTKTSTTEIIASLQPEILDRPFNDTGTHRTISWKALGITLHIGFENTFVLTPIVEGIIATLQIMVTELAGLDLSLLPTSVHLNVIYNEDKTFELSEMLSNKTTKWTITVSNKFENLTLDQIEEYIVSSALTILQSCSLHPHKKLGEIFENLGIEGFPRKVFTIRPYHELWRAILPEDCFNFEVRHSLEPKALDICWDFQEHEALQAFKGKGITYTKEKSLIHIKNRYQSTVKPIRITLKRLMLDKSFISNIEVFRSNKLLDWHILVVIFNIIANHKANQHDAGLQDLKKRTEFVSSWRQQEQVEDDLSVPPELFTLENLQLHWKTFLPTVLKTMGLEIPNSTPDVEAIERFLEEKYNFFIDDIEHEKIFALMHDSQR